MPTVYTTFLPSNVVQAREVFFFNLVDGAIMLYFGGCLAYTMEKMEHHSFLH